MKENDEYTTIAINSMCANENKTTVTWSNDLEQKVDIRVHE